MLISLEDKRFMDQPKAIAPLSTNQAIELMKIGNEFRIDSRIIAKGIGIAHRALIQTLRKYQDRLEKWGVLTFEMSKPLEGSMGGRPETYTMLNKNQVSFAITLSRNTEQVVSFKFDLIEAFDLMEQVIAPQQSVLPQLPPPLFKTAFEAVRANPAGPCPAQDQVEAAIIKTVQWLQPYRPKGVSWYDLLRYNAEIQSYQRTYATRALLALADSLVERTILSCTKDETGADYYSFVPITAYLQSPEDRAGGIK